MVKNVWVKSTCSGPWTDNCVEIQWQTACESNACVEVGQTNCNCHGGEILIRDSKNPDGPVLSFSQDEWVAFIDRVKRNQFDLP